jgi:hypothetical protein
MWGNLTERFQISLIKLCSIRSHEMDSGICGAKFNFNIIVAYLLKSRTGEPEKQPLLANGSKITFISTQWPRNKQRNNIRC